MLILLLLLLLSYSQFFFFLLCNVLLCSNHLCACQFHVAFDSCFFLLGQPSATYDTRCTEVAVSFSGSRKTQNINYSGHKGLTSITVMKVWGIMNFQEAKWENVLKFKLTLNWLLSLVSLWHTQPGDKKIDPIKWLIDQPFLIITEFNGPTQPDFDNNLLTISICFEL